MDNIKKHRDSLQNQNIIKDYLNRTAYEKCIPIKALLEITLKCNLQCLHCYNFDRTKSYPDDFAAKELQYQEIINIIDQLAEANCLYLIFTGGEPLLSSHLFDYIQYARKRRFVVKIKTNGTLLTDKNITMLIESGASGADISLYGATRETHDAITCSPGLFDKTVQAIKNAKNAGLKIRISYCIINNNFAEVENMIKLAEKFNITYGVDPHITARHDGTQNSLGNRINCDMMKVLYKGHLNHLINRSNQFVQCDCARAVCAISAYGNVYPCIALPIQCGNIREKSFIDIWQNSHELSNIRKLNIEDLKACKLCDIRSFCKRKICNVFLNTGDYTGKEELTCIEASVIKEICMEKEAVKI